MLWFCPPRWAILIAPTWLPSAMQRASVQLVGFGIDSYALAIDGLLRKAHQANA